ncbi:MAG: carboxynorspermidine decarboxylase [Haliscomenobacter sp.]|nr:carboxynorspermidine decarboxylase [Haliscomenobacter sp.]MBK8877565.1 carboxynorspermidine decarboxylase [Haliscomenobacter sp.]
MIDYTKVPSPSFVLEEARLKTNLELIRSVQERAGVKVILALKGFSMWRMFPAISRYLDGATASSLHEARLIYEEMGIKAHTYSPAFLPDEFSRIMRYSSHITFNSTAQYHRYKEELALTEEPVSSGLRVNPLYSEVETPLYNPAAPGSRLGETPEHLASGLPEGIEGLHAHTLCESTAEATERLISAVETHFGAFLPRLKWVNFGGGHLMTRKGYDLERLIGALKSFKDRHPHLEVILEPGSAIAWETGELVATVLDIVESGGITTAMVDVSFTAHMPDTLEMPYRPRILGASDPEPGKPAYRIGGVSCLAGDFMEAYAFDRPLAIGDRLVFWDMIHYTMVKTTMFNGVKHPNICLWHEDGDLELVRQFGYDDFKNRLS